MYYTENALTLRSDCEGDTVLGEGLFKWSIEISTMQKWSVNNEHWNT